MKVNQKVHSLTEYNSQWSFCRIGSTLQTHSSRDADRRPRSVTTPAKFASKQHLSLMLICLRYMIHHSFTSAFPFMKNWLQCHHCNYDAFMAGRKAIRSTRIDASTTAVVDFSRTAASVTSSPVVTSSRAGHGGPIWIEFRKATN